MKNDHSHISFKILKTALPVFLLLLASGCGEKDGTAPAAAAAPSALEVEVVTVQSGSVALSRELPGRTSAYRVAEVRARANGIVLKRLFEEGEDVKQGQLLYEIDPAPYQAALNTAKANLARAEAAAQLAKLQEARMKHLIDTSAVSQQDYDNALASLQVAKADVAAAKAAVQTAEINLGYTQVTSPIDGRIGLSQVTEGAYVQAGMATLMATVQQLDPMYVNLVQPSTEVLRLKRAFEQGTLKPGNDSEDVVGVNLIMEDGRSYAYSGELQFSDVTVNSSTGAVTLRVLFPNPDVDLLPGVFVRSSFVEAINPNTILVPQQAVSRNYRGEPTVWVVVDGKATLQVLETAGTYGDQWIVNKGVKEGDQVITNNLVRLRPNAPVRIAR